MTFPSVSVKLHKMGSTLRLGDFLKFFPNPPTNKTTKIFYIYLQIFVNICQLYMQPAHFVIQFTLHHNL